MVMEELTIRISKETVDALRMVAKAMHMPVEFVIDQFVLHAAPEDPDSAFHLTMGHYLISISRLSKKDAAQVFGDIAAIFLSAIPPGELDEMVSEIKSLGYCKYDRIEPATEEEYTAFKKAVDKVVQIAKDEYMRTVVYSLLHR